MLVREHHIPTGSNRMFDDNMYSWWNCSGTSPATSPLWYKFVVFLTSYSQLRNIVLNFSLLFFRRVSAAPATTGTATATGTATTGTATSPATTGTGTGTQSGSGSEQTTGSGNAAAGLVVPGMGGLVSGLVGLVGAVFGAMVVVWFVSSFLMSYVHGKWDEKKERKTGVWVSVRFQSHNSIIFFLLIRTEELPMLFSHLSLGANWFSLDIYYSKWTLDRYEPFFCQINWIITFISDSILDE